PRLPHVSAPSKHPTVQISFNADNAEPLVFLRKKGIARHSADVRLDIGDGSNGINMMGDVDSHSRIALFSPRLEYFNLIRTGVPFAHTRNADGIIIREELRE